jgi:nucleotide-binding universal stress UspA family protein
MPHTILVSLDGSPLAERALPYAEALARPGGGRLALVRAVPLLSRPTGGGPYPTLAAAYAAAAEANDYLARMAAGLEARGFAASTAAPRGDEADGILAEAQRVGADMIVLTTHGRAGLGRWVYGSVTEEVLARTSLPTLIVRAWLPEGVAALLARHPTILVPLDGSVASEAVLPFAIALATDLDGTLLLLRAVARPDLALAPDFLLGPLLREELSTARVAAEDYLRGVVTRVAQTWGRVESVVCIGRPGLDMAATVIEAVGRERNAALVVMTSRRRTGVDRLLLGSITDVTLRHGTLPVLLVRP